MSLKTDLRSDSHSYNHLNHVLLCSARSSCLYCQTTRGCHGGPQRQGWGNWSECLFLISTHFNLIRFYLELLVAFEFTPVLTVPVSSAGVSRAGRLPKTLWTSAPGPGRAAPALQRLSGHPAEPHLAAETMSSRWSLSTAAPHSNNTFIYVAVSVSMTCVSCTPNRSERPLHCWALRSVPGTSGLSQPHHGQRSVLKKQCAVDTLQPRF